jgi:hypothetical protein
MGESSIIWPKAIKNKDLPIFLKELTIYGGVYERLSRRKIFAEADGEAVLYRKTHVVWELTRDPRYLLGAWLNRANIRGAHF